MLAAILAVTMFAVPSVVHADSPVTSTPIHEAYSDVAMVQITLDQGLSPAVIQYLSSGDAPLGERAAVVNALYAGNVWDERDLADQYARAVYGKDASLLKQDELNGVQAFVLGYMQVLDRYMFPDLTWMNKARADLPESRTVAMVHALAHSQRNMGCSWVNTERVLNDSSLNNDLREQAVDIVVDYMQLYQGDTCEGNTNELAEELMAQSIVLAIGTPRALNYGTPATVDRANAETVPYLSQGLTMVPLRFLADAFGAEVAYDASTKEVRLQYDGKDIRLNGNTGAVTVNGTAGAARAAVEISQGRTFVPLRVVAELFGKDVHYDRGLILIADDLSLSVNNEQDRVAADLVRTALYGSR